MSKVINAEAKEKELFFVDELDDSVVRKLAMFSTSSLVP
jgi:hypothetical protein